MEKIIEKLETGLEKYITNLEEKPIKTILKTAVIIWLIKKLKDYLK